MTGATWHEVKWQLKTREEGTLFDNCEILGLQLSDWFEWKPSLTILCEQAELQAGIGENAEKKKKWKKKKKSIICVAFPPKIISYNLIWPCTERLCQGLAYDVNTKLS